MNPRTIGQRYQLEVLAGAGGMGSVYRATDRQSGARVAVKVVAHRPRRTSKSGETRFDREAAVLADVRHPGIVRYIDHGECPEGHYLVMEWVGGASLADRLRQGPLAEADALELAERLANALAYLTARGIVHRDVKPDNIMLAEGDVTRPILVDFGIARTLHGEALTRTGAMLGTPRYMAPEQIRAPTKVDGRADVFSLGCVLFECLAGRPAYDDPDPVTVLSRILLDPPPRLGAIVPGVASALDVFVSRLLARNPKERPAPDGALLETFGELRAGSVVAGGLEVPATVAGTLADEQRRAQSRAWRREGPLFGRSAELAEASAMLAAEGVVVIWGPPGVGKTRIAQELLAHAGAAPLVFEGARDLEEALRAQGTSPEQAVEFWEAQEDVVGVFDGAEAIVEELGAAIAAWRAAAPHVRFVVTSRRLPHDTSLPVVQVGPLDPAAGAELFEAHVRQQRADATAEADLGGLVAAMEGNPLALKLAAARYPILGLGGLLERAKRPLDLLTSQGESRMRASIRQSWDLLSPAARDVLAAAAVFPGTFAFSDICAVVPELTETEVLGELERLREHSLLVSEARGPLTRLHLSPPIREFAEERLDERAELELRHGLLADHVVARLAGRARVFQRTGQPEALADLVMDAATAELVLEESLTRAEGERALSLGLLLEPVWAVRGALGSAREKLDRILAAAPTASPNHPRVRQARGRILGTLGKFDEAKADLAAARLAAEASGDAEWVQTALVDMAVVHHQAREIEAARRLYDEVLAESAGEGTRAEARALANLGALCHDEGQLDVARAYYVEAVALLEAIGDARQGGICAGNLAVLEHESGRPDDAARRFEQAIAWLHRADDGRLTGITLGNYGMYWLERGDRTRAIALLEEAKTRLAHAGDGRSEALALGRLAAALALEGRPDDAMLALSRGERLATRRDALTRHAVTIQRMLVDLAAAHRALCDGNRSEARQRLSAAHLRRESSDSPFSSRGGTPRERSDDVRAALRIAAPLFDALDRALST